MGPIVHVVQHLRPGGLEVMALELARVQSARHPVKVVSLEGDEAETLAAWPRLASQRDQLVFLGKRPGLDGGLPLRLARLFRQWRPAMVHTHHIGPLLYAGVAARLAGVACRVHTEHDAWHLRDPKRRRVAQLALALARPLLVADAPHVADAVAETLGRPRPLVILNGIDTERFRPGSRTEAREALGLAPQERIVGIAARLETVKGVDVALRAFALLRSPARLAIAGSGTQDAALRALAQELGITGRVTFLGHIDDMAGFYRALDVLCLPSRSEGLPLSLLEAQASGVPVVASRVGGVPAAVCPDSGRLVPAENPPALAEALEAALDGDRGDPRPFVQAGGSLTTMADAYLALAGQAIAGPVRGAAAGMMPKAAV